MSEQPEKIEINEKDARERDEVIKRMLATPPKPKKAKEKKPKT